MDGERDGNGSPCTSLQEQQQRWRRHFTNILNIHDAEELEKVRQRELRPEIAEPPTKEELEETVGKLKNAKAGGTSNILPEMVKAACCEDEFLDLLLDLVHTVWRESAVPKEWTDAVLIPIPKKGDLSKCDNWWGISLLDVVGKVVVRILQERLQQLAEDELPESQCGFKKLH